MGGTAADRSGSPPRPAPRPAPRPRCLQGKTIHCGSQGVRVARLDEGDEVVSAAAINSAPPGAEEETESTPEAAK